MSGSFEKSVKGGTKIKAAAPKAKYVEHILVATHAGEAGVAEIFRALQNRLRDSTWTIVFKALIIVHLMIREGEPNVTLKFLADSPSKLAIANFSDVQAQGTNIRRYHSYLLTRAKAYRDTKIDWVREGQGRLKKQTVDKGLLRETEAVQSQINILLKCDLLNNDYENEITLTAFRLLTMDLLILFGIMNEGTINVLEHYFEMSKPDAVRAFNIYTTFGRQTDNVVQFLSIARQYENATRLEIPKLKHAPTSLTSSLEEYLNDPDFEINRRQYLAQQEAKKGKKNLTNGPSKPLVDPQKKNVSKGISNTPVAAQHKQEPKGPAPDLIDFFDSIEQNQQPLATQPQSFQNDPQFFRQPQQSTYTVPSQSLFQNGQLQHQQSNSFFPATDTFGQSQGQPQQPLQPEFTGAGFGGYTHQPLGGQQQNQYSGMPQSNVPDLFAQQQPQQSQQQLFSPALQSFQTGPQSPHSTNPFRQNSPPTAASTASFTNSPAVAPSLSRQGTNPFARNVVTNATGQSHTSSFGSVPPTQLPQSFPQQPSLFNQPSPQLVQPQQTGTNPFARNLPSSSMQQSPPQAMAPSATGSTNPFRQSMFVNQQTGQGWQSTQGSMGGLEQLETVPVFPRPGQLQQQQQQPWP